MKEPALVHRKVAILGFRAVGKSSLTSSFVTGVFSEQYDPTIESTHHKTIRFRKVHFATDIVDTAGMVSIAAELYMDTWSVAQLFLTDLCLLPFTGRILTVVSECLTRCTWLRTCLQYCVKKIL